MTDLRFVPVAPGLWPTLFMTATIHTDTGIGELWRVLGMDPDELEPIVAIARVGDGPRLLAALEPTELAGDEDDMRPHARLRLWVIPLANGQVDEAGLPEGDVPLDALLAAVRKATAPRPYFDCLATCLFPPKDFATRIPLPLRMWEPVGSLFAQLVGARFELKARGLSDAWLAMDLVNDPKAIRVQVHFEKRYPVTASSAVDAWNRVHGYITEGIIRKS